MQPVMVMVDSFEWPQYDSPRSCWLSHTTVAMAQKLYLIPFIWRSFITKWCFNFISTLSLSYSSCLSRSSGPCITVRRKSLSAVGWYPATPGRSRSQQNFADSSSDSDSRQNGRLRPTPTPVSTPTPQPWLKLRVFLHQIPKIFPPALALNLSVGVLSA